MLRLVGIAGVFVDDAVPIEENGSGWDLGLHKRFSLKM
jgi:hypothetical protein